MKIHEFLSSHRDEIHGACVRNAKRGAAGDWSDEDLTPHLRVFVEQVIQRLRRAAGLPESIPVPALAQTAAIVGHEVQQRGLGIEEVARGFATLSVSMAEVGGRYRLAFDAEEYGAFHQAIDDSIAVAIDQFMKDASAAHQLAASERLGFLAHELRNSITAAKLAFALIERGRSDDGRAPSARIVKRSLHRMTRLVEQTLVDVRMREAAPLPLRRFGIVPLLRDLESDCFPDRRIRVVVDAPDEELMALADEQLLTMAIGNMLQNAVAYSRPDTLVALRAYAVAPDGVVVEVEDECGGLPEGAMDEIFKPFVRRREDGRGFGLGLAILRRAADALGGDVTVRDLPGKGCVFALRLRAVETSLVSGAHVLCADAQPDSAVVSRS